MTARRDRRVDDRPVGADVDPGCAVAGRLVRHHGTGRDAGHAGSHLAHDAGAKALVDAARDEVPGAERHPQGAERDDERRQAGADHQVTVEKTGSDGEHQHDAEDVLQDSFIKIFLNIKSYSGRGTFEAWASRIVANTALSFIRKKRQAEFSNAVEEADNQSSDEVGEILPKDITGEELLSLLHELPTGYKIVLNMYLIECFSHKEIADRLGIKEGSSRSQYLKARRHFQQLIESSILKNKKSWISTGIILNLLRTG